MNIRSLFIAQEDHDRFFDVLENARRLMTKADAHLRRLEYDMARARTVPAKEIPANVVALYSWVRLRLSDPPAEITCQVVLPAEADAEEGRVSILSPLAADIIGHRLGEEVIVEARGACRRVKILGVFHQPRREPTHPEQSMCGKHDGRRSPSPAPTGKELTC